MGVATGCGCKEVYRFLILLIPTPLVSVINPRCACAARVTVVVFFVCVFVCPIDILRMAALSIELSHVLFIKSNYLPNGCVVCRKTFVPEIQPKLLLRVLQAAWPRL